MMKDKKMDGDRYDEIVAEYKQLEIQAIENQNMKDEALNEYRKRQKPINIRMGELQREIVKVIKTDPERAKKYQAFSKQ